MEFDNNNWFVVTSGVAPIYKSASFNSTTLLRQYMVNLVEFLK